MCMARDCNWGNTTYDGRVGHGWEIVIGVRLCMMREWDMGKAVYCETGFEVRLCMVSELGYGKIGSGQTLEQGAGFTRKAAYGDKLENG